jgi:hypothetical protein
MKINCSLSIVYIKHEFLRERGVTNIDRQNNRWHYKTPYSSVDEGERIILSEQQRIIYMNGLSAMRDEVMKASNGDELNVAMLKWAHITLNDWIESL